MFDGSVTCRRSGASTIRGGRWHKYRVKWFLRRVHERSAVDDLW